MKAYTKATVDHNGAYLEDCAPAIAKESWATDKKLAEKLWKMTEELVGERYEF